MSTALALGSSWELHRTLTQADLDGFAEITGDDNPIHVDPDYAAGTAFGATVAHGMFLYALVRAELRRRFPGAVLRAQRLQFTAPTTVGSTVTVTLRVSGLTADTALVATTVTTTGTTTGTTDGTGAVGLEGDCELRLPAGGIR